VAEVGWTVGSGDVMVLDGPALIEWINAGCLAQGVPVLVSDAAVVRHVCTLLTGRGEGPERRLRRRDPALDRSQAPLDVDPAMVEGSGSGCARQDRDEGDDGLDDG